MKRYFCTYFDDSYMVYGLTMFRSLADVCPDFQLFVLCLNDSGYQKLLHLDKKIVPITLKDLEEYDKELAAVKSTRSVAEYYFTISPCLPLFLFHQYPYVDYLTYCDADLFFISSPECLFSEMQSKSVLLCRHNFSIEAQSLAAEAGIYNVAFQIYKNCDDGKKCLQWWRDRCLEWCFDRFENGKFADQKYLEQMIKLFPDAVISTENSGADVALWNIGRYNYQYVSPKQIDVDNVPVIFVHYQGYRLLNKHFIRWPFCGDDTIPRYVWNSLAKLYYKELMKTIHEFNGIFNDDIFYLSPKRMCMILKNNHVSFLNFLPDNRLREYAKLFYISLRRRNEGITFFKKYL